MAYRKPPFVHIARAPEQATTAPVQASAGGVLSRLRERLTGGSHMQADADEMSAPADTHWDADR
jgi:hypothetical protein